MADVLLFHHIQGLTDGVVAFADRLRAAGHTVHTPDLFAGRTFADISAGQAYCSEVGFGAVAEAGVAQAEGFPEALVYAGFSLGAMPAQQLAQTRAGALGALLLHSCIPPEEFGSWPDGLPAQVHAMAGDSFWHEGDRDAAIALAADQPQSVEVFEYPGDEHLFADSSLPSYDAAAAGLLTERVLDFLDRVSR